MNDMAVLVIDIQNDYFPGGRFPLPGAPAAVSKAEAVLAEARGAGIAVIHVRHEFLVDDAPFFAPSSKGAAIHPRVAALEGESVVLKHRPNAFVETNLEALLREGGVGMLVICGMMTNMCVDATVRAAKDMGFGCMVIHDACAAANLSFDGEDVSSAKVHAAFIAALSGTYAEVRSAEDWLKAISDRE
jgi:nicotinamidase-related amidase